MCASNTVGVMVVSCADPGIFARGEGGGGPKKTSDNVFHASVFLQFYKGVSMVYFKESYIF